MSDSWGEDDDGRAFGRGRPVDEGSSKPNRGFDKPRRGPRDNQGEGDAGFNSWSEKKSSSRNFKSADDWGDSNTGNGGSDSWGDGGKSNDRGNNGYRGGRGEHGDQRRRNDRDGKSRGDRNTDNGGDGWGDEEKSNDWGGKGGRRGGDGERRKGNDRDESNGDAPEKPREKYIPPEPTNDENEMFGSGNTTGINFDKYDDIDVKVTGENIPPKIRSFDQSGLRPFLLNNVKKCNYLKPTPIQKHAIPIIMSGRDMMGCAQTGSGKTAAFLLPILHKLLDEPVDLVYDSVHCEPQAVIVAPTRELAIQIHDECRKFSHGSIIKTLVNYGGTAAFHQARQLLNGCHVLVATPGRLNDFTNSGKLTFNSVRFVVLDEADRMLDMGFLPEMEKLMNHETMVPVGERQTLMFSATFPEEVQRLASQFLQNYIFITVGIVGGACSDVTQTFHQVEKFDKRNKLLEVLREEGTSRTLIFVETKRNADFLATILCQSDIKTTSIHGDRLQREREQALGDFKHGRHDVLVATGVAARGLDIKNVKHVINYDLPKTIDEYVHRIGRTGRVGNQGRATSFYDCSQDLSLTADLVKILEQAKQPVPDWLKSSSMGGGSYSGHSNFGGRDVRKGNFNQDNSPANNEFSEGWD